MAFSLTNLFASWEGMGIFEIALPFLLIFTLIFALLERSKILGAESRRFNIIIAAIFGLFVVRNAYIVGLIHRLLPNISLIIVGIVMFLLLVGIFLGREYSGVTGALLGFVVLVSLFLVLWSVGSDALGVNMPSWVGNLFDRVGLDTLLFVIGFIVVLALIIGAGKRGGEKNPLKILGKGLEGLGGGFS